MIASGFKGEQAASQTGFAQCVDSPFAPEELPEGLEQGFSDHDQGDALPGAKPLQTGPEPASAELQGTQLIDHREIGFPRMRDGRLCPAESFRHHAEGPHLDPALKRGRPQQREALSGSEVQGIVAQPHAVFENSQAQDPIDPQALPGTGPDLPQEEAGFSGVDGSGEHPDNKPGLFFPDRLGRWLHMLQPVMI